MVLEIKIENSQPGEMVEVSVYDSASKERFFGHGAVLSPE